MCVVAESPQGHNSVIIRRHRGLRAATAEEAGCRGLHGFGGYDQENDNNKKKLFGVASGNNWLKFKGRNKWKRLETAGKSDFYCHTAKKDNEKPAGG